MPIYKEHSDKQRPCVYVVYIRVNMEICTHFSPWHNFIDLNAEVGFQILLMHVYVSVYRFTYPQIIWSLNGKEKLPKTKQFFAC